MQSCFELFITFVSSSWAHNHLTTTLHIGGIDQMQSCFELFITFVSSSWAHNHLTTTLHIGALTKCKVVLNWKSLESDFFFPPFFSFL
jgi:hypothetical protein